MMWILPSLFMFSVVDLFFHFFYGRELVFADMERNLYPHSFWDVVSCKVPVWSALLSGLFSHHLCLSFLSLSVQRMNCNSENQPTYLELFTQGSGPTSCASVIGLDPLLLYNNPEPGSTSWLALSIPSPKCLACWTIDEDVHGPNTFVWVIWKLPGDHEQPTAWAHSPLVFFER